ncbi:MAG: hypothetical protein AAGA68_19835 [Pseudomonadota bacterium]
MKHSVVFIATLIHRLPRPFAMSPVGTLALHRGAHGPKPLAWPVPLVPLTIAALIFGFYDLRGMICAFGGFALATSAGCRLLRALGLAARHGAGALLGAAFSLLLLGLQRFLERGEHDKAVLA